MRVLLALYRDDPNAGGSLRVGETLAKGLRRLGVKAEVCFAYGGPGPVGKGGTVPCHYLGLPSSRSLFQWVRFRAFLKVHRPEIVHFIDPVLAMQLATTGMRYRRVVHVHGAIIRPRISWRTRLEWRFLDARADLFVCITEGARHSLKQRGLVQRTGTAVVYNSIDFPWFQGRPSRAEARRQFGLPQDALVIGMVGRLSKSKGFDDLLRVLALLTPRWHALIVGGGPDRARLEDLAEALGVQQRVCFTGALEDVRPAYAATDAYAFLTTYEPFGLVLAEAMSCRVPVFGLERAGEYREAQNPLITDDNAIFLQGSQRKSVDDVEDPSVLGALARRIEECGQRPDLYAGMVDKAWEHVRQHFASEAQANAMLRLYRSLVGMDAEPAALSGIPG